MLGRITVSRTFSTEASPSAVWAALESAPRWPEVLTDLVSARIEPDGVLAPGATIRTVAKPGTRAVDMTYRVVAADPRLHLVIEAEGDGFRAHTEYAIDAFAAGSRVTVTSNVEPVRWLHKITTALTRRAYTRQFEAMMEARMLPMLALAERIQRS
jgi:Polyketide cyclase / dehydrase and lipid transport